MICICMLAPSLISKETLHSLQVALLLDLLTGQKNNCMDFHLAPFHQKLLMRYVTDDTSTLCPAAHISTAYAHAEKMQ